MSGQPWNALMQAFNGFIENKMNASNTNHIVSVIYYGSRARIVANQEPIKNV